MVQQRDSKLGTKKSQSEAVKKTLMRSKRHAPFDVVEKTRRNGAPQARKKHKNKV
jgi:hypothetical protein